MPAKAKTSANTPSAPASQRGNQGTENPGDIVRDQELTDLIAAELGQPPEARTEPPAGKEPASGDTTAETTDDSRPGEEAAPEPPPREDGESDEDYAARLEEAGFDPEEVEAAEAETTETEEERAARLQQDDGESDEDYEARLAEEGLTRDDVPEAPAAAEGQDGKPKVPAGLQKRFKTLTDRNKSLEAEIAQLKAAAKAPAPRALSSLEELANGVTTAAEADDVRGKLEAWEDWAMRHPEGLEIPAKDGGDPVTYTREQIAGTLADARQGLRALTRRAGFVEKRATAEEAALKAYPAFADPDSAVSKAYDAIARGSPALVASVPDLKLFVADALRGRDLRQRAAAGRQLPGKPAPRTVTPPAAGRTQPPRGRAPNDAAKARRTADALARVEKGGGEGALADLIEAGLR